VAGLEAAEEDLFQHLDPEERFQKSEPSPTPPGMSAAVERIFSAPDLTAVDRHLACRGTLCQLELVFRSDGPEVGDWMQALQRDSELMEGGMSFHGGYPGTDPVTKEGIDTTFVYLYMDERRDISAWLMEELR